MSHYGGDKEANLPLKVDPGCNSTSTSSAGPTSASATLRPPSATFGTRPSCPRRPPSRRQSSKTRASPVDSKRLNSSRSNADARGGVRHGSEVTIALLNYPSRVRFRHLTAGKFEPFFQALSVLKRSLMEVTL